MNMEEIGMENIIQYIIIIVILLVIAFAIIRAKRKDFNLEANKLVEYLGGKDNLIDYEIKESRFIVNLKDTEKVDKDAIQKMGAKGIVEIENQLKIIIGDNAKALKKQIDDLK